MFRIGTEASVKEGEESERGHDKGGRLMDWRSHVQDKWGGRERWPGFK